MRYLFAAILILTLIPPASAQKVTIQDGKMNGILPVNEQGEVTYQTVQAVQGVSKEELFKRARTWFVKTYNSSNQVLQVNDPTTGELIGKGTFRATGKYGVFSHDYVIKHTLQVEVKEGRYRLTLNDFSIDEPSFKGPIDKIPMGSKKLYDSLFSSIDAESVALLISLEKALNTANDF